MSCNSHAHTIPTITIYKHNTHNQINQTSNRLLFLDETATNERNEQARQSKLHEERYTHEANILIGQRRFRKILKGAAHMTGVSDYNGAGN